MIEGGNRKMGKRNKKEKKQVKKKGMLKKLKKERSIADLNCGFRILRSTNQLY